MGGGLSQKGAVIPRKTCAQGDLSICAGLHSGSSMRGASSHFGSLGSARMQARALTVFVALAIGGLSAESALQRTMTADAEAAPTDSMHKAATRRDRQRAIFGVDAHLVAHADARHPIPDDEPPARLQAHIGQEKAGVGMAETQPSCMGAPSPGSGPVGAVRARHCVSRLGAL